MIGFKYKSKNSLSDFDIIAKSVDRPLLPALKKNELALSGMHGYYDFGGNTYDNRIVSVLLQFVGNNINGLRLQAREIAAWLSSDKYLPLIFDDEPDKYYLAKIYDSSDLKTITRVGEATIKFECRPFAYALASTGEDIPLNSEIPLNSKTLLNKLKVTVTGNTTYAIDYFGTQEVGLGSPTGSKFDIVITGSFTSFSIGLNDKTLTYTGQINNQTVIIDNVNATVKVNGNKTLSNLSGDTGQFLKLVPGINTVTINGTGLNCSVLFDFRPQYI